MSGPSEEHDEGGATLVGDASADDAPSRAPGVGRGHALGRYVVVEELGSGAMGTVYRAYDPELDRGIAIKLVEIRAARWRNPAEIRTRIMREAQAIARVQHPNVVQVFDVGEVEFAVWVAMEFVDGHTLKQWSRQPGRTWREILHAFVCAGEGLAAAHRADIVHRDFKPENVMIGRDGRVRVLDFGLARALSGPTTRDGVASQSANLPIETGALEVSLTAQGAVMGTPAYMAPEQHLGRATGAAADQFALCVSLWEALYGQRPFLGESHAALAFAATQGKVTPPPAERGVPRWVHTALLRGLQPEPAARYPDIKALVAALEADPARRNRRVFVTLGFVGAVVGAAVLARSAGKAPEGAQCTGAAAHLQTVWGGTQRQSMQQAFTASELPFAADSFAAVAAALDAWGTSWVSAHTEACRATRVLGEQSLERMDLRVGCLERQLADVDALVRLLDTAERDVVIGAVDATAALPRVAACSDLEYLTARVPPPADPERAAGLAALTAVLSPIEARVHAGAYDRVLAQLVELQPRIAALDHPPLSADYFRLCAVVQEATGDARLARESWEHAFASNIRGKDTRQAAVTATKLVYVVGHRLSNRPDGERWALLARELIRASDDDGPLLASLWSAQASMLSMHGEYTEAIALERKAVALWLRDDPSAVQLGMSYGNIGNGELLRGNTEAAAELVQKEVDSMIAHYGQAHPETGAARARLASALSHARRFDEAEPLFRSAIEILRQSEGRGSTRVANAMDGLGRVLRQQGKLDEAVAQHRQALDVWRAAVGEDHPDVAVSMMHIGYTLAANKDWQGALDAFERADDTFRRAVGDGHPQRIYAANSRANMLLMLERPADAVPIVEAALALEATRQVDPTLLAESEFILAQALWNSGSDRPRALVLAERARQVYAAGPDTWAEDLAKLEATLQTWSASPP